MGILYITILCTAASDILFSHTYRNRFAGKILTRGPHLKGKHKLYISDGRLRLLFVPFSKSKLSQCYYTRAAARNKGHYIQITAARTAQWSTGKRYKRGVYEFGVALSRPESVSSRSFPIHLSPCH